MSGFLKEIEAIAFYKDLDGETFTDYMLNQVKVATIDGNEFPISEFCTRENLKGFWDASMDVITEWLGSAFDERKTKSYAMWLAQGFIFGFIWGKAEGK